GSEELRGRARPQRADRSQRDRHPGAAPKLRRIARILIARTPAIEGRCDARFGALRDAFAANFAELDEVGAGVCVELRGLRVVDLWGGHRDAARTQPWSEDTLVNAYSVGKGVVAMLVLALIERGEIALDGPVAAVWPGFAAAGKQAVTVRTLLSHGAGLPAVRERLPDEALYDWDRMCAALASQAPDWEAGAVLGGGHGTGLARQQLRLARRRARPTRDPFECRRGAGSDRDGSGRSGLPLRAGSARPRAGRRGSDGASAAARGGAVGARVSANRRRRARPHGVARLLQPDGDIGHWNGQYGGVAQCSGPLDERSRHGAQRGEPLCGVPARRAERRSLGGRGAAQRRRGDPGRRRGPRDRARVALRARIPARAAVASDRRQP